MTREERIEVYMMNNRRNLAELLVGREDDLEQRTCGNCKYWGNRDYGNNSARHLCLETAKDFGCINFEPKENK